MTTVTSTPIRTDEANYIVKVREAKSISMTNLRLYECYIGEIIRIDTGAVAYSTRYYNSIRSARLQAARYLKRYEHHLAKNGIGFEEQEAARKAEERSARDAKREADRRVRDEAPAMLEALRTLMLAAQVDGVPAGWGCVVDPVRAILARIDGNDAEECISENPGPGYRYRDYAGQGEG
jgi:hypothetical protein